LTYDIFVDFFDTFSGSGDIYPGEGNLKEKKRSTQLNI